jgi:catechol 2,3-dioxygenase-like lactoylglutathione lyase family enzyme
MIDHVSVAVRDLAAATKFYDVVLNTLGYQRLDTRPQTAGWGKKYSDFWINLRPNMTPVPPDSGVHICLRATSKATVDAFHAAALANGGSSDGAPGPRNNDDPRYYAAFIRDPDGNRIEAVTFLDV